MTDQTTKLPSRRLSLQGKLIFGSFLVIIASLAAAIGLHDATQSAAFSVSVAAIVAIVLVVSLIRYLIGPTTARIGALIDSADSLRDADFSFTIADSRDDELGDLVRAYNLMVGTLREERQNLHQRELMLDTVLQASPLALVLCNDSDQVIYANATARTLFSAGAAFAGRRFIGDVIDAQPTALVDAFRAGTDSMVTIEENTQTERYHLSCNDFTLNARAHRLYLLKRLTHELNRQEVATWKKVIRLIGHELNNSLAPISSLAHSGQVLLERGETERVPGLLATIETRSIGLKDFIEGYSRFAKLPLPNKQGVAWQPFLERLQQLQSFVLQPVIDGAQGFFDPQQMEQVVINLCKNAAESGSSIDEVVLSVEQQSGGWLLTVEDAGRGMSEEALTSALLPFYSTKKSGSGLGLSLCREIVDAHNGRIGLQNRASGGVQVSVWLPQN
ncbi:MAG: PAS domain-containing sensor histidine kinase [Woeseiaceae bacterium]